MTEEYKVSAGLKLFYGLCSWGMFVFSLWLLPGADPKGVIPLIIITVVFFCVSVLVTINIFRRKVVVSKTDMVCVFLFSTRKIEIADIKGARIERSVVIIESLKEGIKPIVISNYDDLKNSDKLRAWVQNNFKDLNDIDLQNEHQQLLNDSKLGNTEDERLKKLTRAKTIATAYNIGATVLGFAMIFFNSTFGLYVLLGLPLIVICIFHFSGGLIKFLSNSQRSIYRQIVFGISLSCFYLFLHSFLSYSLFELKNIWLPALLTMGIFFLLLYSKGINHSIGVIKQQVIAMFVVSALYGFSSVRSVNCAFDNSNKKIFEATILKHRVSKGRSTSYFLTLSAWGPQANVEEVEIGRKLYYDVSVGDTVEIQLKEGLLHIPWFKVKKRILSTP